MLQAEVAEQTGAEDCIYCDDVPGATTTDGSGREMPAHLFLWASPEDCAQDLIETFGVHWCRMLAVDLRDRIRRGGVR